jgi:alkanesulfonate monooxygenase SsuD/methylene tetrahydromethanopterin reductase-like flavin-dependent oxidoreductase (luciferase family)
VGERFDRLEEQLAVITGLWATQPGETFSHAGPHYPVVDSPGLTKPVQPGGVPIIIGGSGKRRTPALAARYAAEFNAAFDSAEASGRLFDRVRAACSEVGRDPAELTCSAAQVVCLGADEATLRRRADAIGREVAELRANGLAGSPDEIVDKVGSFAEVGAGRLYLQVLDLTDLDHLAEIADGVLRQLP